MSIKDMKRVLIYGEAWRGTMPYSFSHALSRLGYGNAIFDYTTFLPSRDANRYVRKIRNLLAQVRSEKQLSALNTAFVAMAKTFGPDLIMVFKGLHVLPQTIRSLQAAGMAVINCHVDDFFNTGYLQEHSKECFNLYDMHFSSRRHLFEEYRQKGARAVGFYEFAYDPTVFYPLGPNGQAIPPCAVSFVGSWSPYRTEQIEALGGLDEQVHVWGWGWQRAKGRLAKYPNIKLWNKLAYLEDFCRVVAGSKICLNILTPENRDQSNLRNFEIPACRGFQLAQRTKQILTVFGENESIACYEGSEELRNKVIYFLEHSEQRQAIQHKGYELVTKGGHSFVDRCRSVLEQIHQNLD